MLKAKFIFVLLGMAISSTPVLAYTTSASEILYTDSMGRQWFDLNAAAGLSWVELAAVCDNVSGKCSGVLDRSSTARGDYPTDLDMTDLYWASNADVAELIYEIAGLPSGSLDDGEETTSSSDVMGALFSSVFLPTFSHGCCQGEYLTEMFDGYTRTILFDPEMGFLPGRGFIRDSTNTSPFDYFSVGTYSSWSLTIPTAEFGSWLYRPTSVPEPATLALFGLGLAGLGLARRRKI